MFQRGSVVKSIGLVKPVQQLCSRSFSSSPAALVLSKAHRREKATHIKEVNILKQRKIISKLSELDPVLGKPGNPFIARLDAEVKEPNVLTRSYEKAEVEKLLYGAQEASIKADFASDSIRQNAVKQREAVFRILNMRNRSAAEAMKLKVDLAVKEFQRFEGDTGSSEVQAAVATVKIYNLYQHVVENHKDFKNIRYMRMLVQKRQRDLRYLKRDNPERYYWTINKLGLNDHVVEMEFNMDKAYMQKFRWYGDKVLVKESQSVKAAKTAARRLERKVKRYNANSKK